MAETRSTQTKGQWALHRQLKATIRGFATALTNPDLFAEKIRRYGQYL
ncbi:MAG: hypothetical protein ACE5JD_16480 [Candidatus Methylomirabilia bacterium]